MRFVLLLLGLMFAAATSAKDLSLDQIRAQLLSKEVVILGRNAVGGASLIDWYVVHGDATGGFKRETVDNASADLRGKRGVVLSVENVRGSPDQGATDVFGKPIDTSRATNPYIYVVVKMLNSSALIGTTTYYNSMMGRSLRLASDEDVIKKEIDSYLHRLVGKTLYKAAFTQLLPPTMRMDELSDYGKREMSRDHQTKNLSPLKVVDARFFDGQNAVVVKVELPDRESRLLFGDLGMWDAKTAPTFRPTLLQRMGISAPDRVPPKFSRQELSAIAKGQIFRGMSEDALYWSWGYPEKTNDWSSGGEQNVYHGHRYVYVKHKAVVDWQRPDTRG